MKSYFYQVVWACLYHTSLVASLRSYNARTGNSRTSEANHDDDMVYASTRRVDDNPYVHNQPVNWRMEDLINRTAFHSFMMLKSRHKPAFKSRGKHTQSSPWINSQSRNGSKKPLKLFDHRQTPRRRRNSSKRYNNKLKYAPRDFNRRFSLSKSNSILQKFHSDFRELVTGLRTEVSRWDRKIPEIGHLTKGDEADGEIIPTAEKENQGGKALRETDTGNTITVSDARNEDSAAPITENHIFQSGIAGNLSVAQHLKVPFDSPSVSVLPPISKSGKNQKKSSEKFNFVKRKISITSINFVFLSETSESQDFVDNKLLTNKPTFIFTNPAINVPLFYVKLVEKKPYKSYDNLIHLSIKRLHTTTSIGINAQHPSKDSFYYNVLSLKINFPSRLIFNFNSSPNVLKNALGSFERSMLVKSPRLFGRRQHETAPHVTKRNRTPPPPALPVEIDAYFEISPNGRSPTTSRKIIRGVTPASPSGPTKSYLRNLTESFKLSNIHMRKDLGSRTKRRRSKFQPPVTREIPFQHMINEIIHNYTITLKNNLDTHDISRVPFHNMVETNQSEYRHIDRELCTLDYSMRVEIMSLVKSSDEISNRLRSQIELLLTRNDARAAAEGTKLKEHGRRRGRRSYARKQLNMIILLPMSLNLIFNYQRVVGAVEIAIRKVVENQLLPALPIKPHYDDSNCSISDGMNAAIEFYAKKEVDVFVGPVCDYAVAPIARQTRYWKIPLLSPGAMASDYGLHKVNMFPMLTRMGYNMNSFVDFLVQLLNQFGWKRFKTLYEPHGMNNIMDRFCHIAADSTYNLIRVGYPHIINDYKAFRLLGDILGNLHKVLGSEWSALCTISSLVLTQRPTPYQHHINCPKTLPTHVSPFSTHAIPNCQHAIPNSPHAIPLSTKRTTLSTHATPLPKHATPNYTHVTPVPTHPTPHHFLATPPTPYPHLHSLHTPPFPKHPKLSLPTFSHSLPTPSQSLPKPPNFIPTLPNSLHTPPILNHSITHFLPTAPLSPYTQTSASVPTHFITNHQSWPHIPGSSTQGKTILSPVNSTFLPPLAGTSH